jgi:hypothetical protein
MIRLMHHRLDVPVPCGDQDDPRRAPPREDALDQAARAEGLVIGVRGDDEEALAGVHSKLGRRRRHGAGYCQCPYERQPYTHGTLATPRSPRG